MSGIIISLLFGAAFSVINVDNSNIVISKPAEPREQRDAYIVVENITREVTGYSSRPEETDESPFVTASNKPVRWKIVATNAYPFGTQMRFPDLYGDTVFIVEDRMNKRYTDRIDIWFQNRSEAERFGLKNTRVQIIKENKPPTFAKK